MTVLRPTIPGSPNSKVHKSIPGVLGIENPPDLPPPLGGEAEASHGGWRLLVGLFSGPLGGGSQV